MKKTVLLLAAALLSLSMSAQKNTLVVGEIDHISGIDSKWAEKLRSEIISGLMASPRLTVIDGNSISGLSSDTAEAIAKLREDKVDCLLTAQISAFTSKKETTDGKTTYKTTLEYTWMITNVADGSARGSKKETHYGSSSAGYNEGLC